MVSEHSFNVSSKPDPTLASELPKMSTETELAPSQCGQIDLQRSMKSLELAVKMFLQMVCERFGLDPIPDDFRNQVDAIPEPQTDPHEHQEQRIEVIGNKGPKDLEKWVDPVVGLKSSNHVFGGSASPPKRHRKVTDDPDMEKISDEVFELSSHSKVSEVSHATRSRYLKKLTVRGFHKVRKKERDTSVNREASVSSVRFLGITLKQSIERVVNEKTQKIVTPLIEQSMCLKRVQVKRWFHKARFKQGSKCDHESVVSPMYSRKALDDNKLSVGVGTDEELDCVVGRDYHVWEPGGSFPPKVRSKKYSEGCVYHDGHCVWYVWDPGEVKMLMGFRQKRNFWSELHHGKYVKDLRLFRDQGEAEMEVSFLLDRRGVVDSTVEIMLLHWKYRKLKQMTNKECDHWRSASTEMVNKVCQSLFVTLEAISSEAKSHMALVIALEKHNLFTMEASTKLLVKLGLRILNIRVVEEESQKRFPDGQLFNCLMKNLDPKSVCSELELIFQEMDKHWKYEMYVVRMSAYVTMITVETYLLAQHKETQGWLLKATCDLMIITVRSDFELEIDKKTKHGDSRLVENPVSSLVEPSRNAGRGLDSPSVDAASLTAHWFFSRISQSSVTSTVEGVKRLYIHKLQTFEVLSFVRDGIQRQEWCLLHMGLKRDPRTFLLESAVRWRQRETLKAEFCYGLHYGLKTVGVTAVLSTEVFSLSCKLSLGVFSLDFLAEQSCGLIFGEMEYNLKLKWVFDSQKIRVQMQALHKTVFSDGNDDEKEMVAVEDQFNGNEEWLIAWIASIIQVPLKVGDMKSVAGVVMVPPGCFVMLSFLLVGFCLVVKTLSGMDTVLSSPENISLLIDAGYQEGKRSPRGIGAGTRQIWRLFQVMKLPRLTMGMKITIAAFNLEDKVVSAGEY